MSDSSQKRLLIVDDDPVVTRVYENLFRKEGVEVVSASDADEAYQKLRDTPPDLVLLDLFLPKVNGVEVLKAIRSKAATKNLPVVVFSTSATSRYVDAAWREGATRFLAKDHFDPTQIVALVRELLDKTEGGRSKAAVVAPPTASNEELEKTIQLLPTLQGELRDRWHGLVIAEHEFRKAKVKEVTVAVEKLSEASDVLRVGLLQQMCSGLLPFLAWLQDKPINITDSALRPGSQATDLMMALCDYAGDLQKEPPATGLIFLAHPKITSVELLPVMRRARLPVVSAKEVTPALSLCAQNRFNLILWDVDLPGPSTSDILHRIHTESSNKETPVTFITKSDDFEARAKEAAAGGYDLLGKPLVPDELAVKALTYIVREQLTKLAEFF